LISRSTSARRHAVFSVTGNFEINVDNTADLSRILPRLPGVNRNQKGLWPHRQKSIGARPARPKSRHSFELAVVIAPARNGNGEQPWL